MDRPSRPSTPSTRGWDGRVRAGLRLVLPACADPEVCTEGRALSVQIEPTLRKDYLDAVAGLRADLDRLQREGKATDLCGIDAIVATPRHDGGVDLPPQERPHGSDPRFVRRVGHRPALGGGPRRGARVPTERPLRPWRGSQRRPPGAGNGSRSRGDRRRWRANPPTISIPFVVVGDPLAAPASVCAVMSGFWVGSGGEVDRFPRVESRIAVHGASRTAELSLPRGSVYTVWVAPGCALPSLTHPKKVDTGDASRVDLVLKAPATP